LKAEKEQPEHSQIISFIRYTPNSECQRQHRQCNDSIDFSFCFHSPKQILNKEGVYEPIDLNRTYTIAGFNYHLIDEGGQGILNGTSIISSDMGQDIEIISIYMQQYLEGKIGQRYADTEGRILITNGE